MKSEGSLVKSSQVIPSSVIWNGRKLGTLNNEEVRPLVSSVTPKPCCVWNVPSARTLNLLMLPPTSNGPALT